MSTGVLAPGGAARARAQLASEAFDLLVVGGGITGVGTALDAVSRGLRVALVEAQDWGAGTSSRSSKLIHGGLRYLQMRDFGLVREALRERAVLVQIAPHLVHPLSLLFPLHRRMVERAYVGAGVTLYDLLARADATARSSAAAFPRHRQLGRRRALELAPALRGDGLVGAICFSDAQVDDARYVLSVLRSAVALGVTALSRSAVVGLRRADGRIAGATVRHLEDGGTTEVRARAVVATTGPWSPGFLSLAGVEGGSLAVRPSKGVHLVVPRDRIASASALILPTRTSVLFVLPWGAHWLVGTTDTPWEHDLARPAATAADVGYLLDTLNAALAHPLGTADVESVYVGVRPLIAAAGTSTSRLSREHAVVRPVPGLVIVSGGKYTTYRVMAAEAVDAALRELGQPPVPSPTATLPIHGAGPLPLRLGSGLGLSLSSARRLYERYGTAAVEVVALAERDPALATPLHGYLAAEFVYGVTHEDARHLDDLLERRTRASLESPDRAVGIAEQVAQLVGPLLGWDAAAARREVAAYRQDVVARRRAEQCPDDASAAAVLAGVPGLLPLP